MVCVPLRHGRWGSKTWVLFSDQTRDNLCAYLMRQQIDNILRPLLPGIQHIKIGGVDLPSRKFIIDELSTAPKLTHLQFCFQGGEGTRRALAEALNKDGSFPALRHLEYPGKEGTYKTGRGRNVRVHEYENPGDVELLQAAKRRGICASVGYELNYKVEGAQRRAGFAAVARRGW